MEGELLQCETVYEASDTLDNHYERLDKKECIFFDLNNDAPLSNIVRDNFADLYYVVLQKFDQLKKIGRTPVYFGKKEIGKYLFTLFSTDLHQIIAEEERFYYCFIKDENEQRKN